jgi:cell wall-associated NlpC family hydrolase
MCRRLSTHFVVLVLLLAFPTLGTAALDRSADGAKPAPQVETLPAPGEEAVEIALRYLGTPYSWAGASPSGFDCSGLVSYVYGRLGVSIPHNAAQQFRFGTPVDRAELVPGDVVFFDHLRHNGIYVGDGRFVHATTPGGVKMARLEDDWFRKRWVGARRL